MFAGFRSMRRRRNEPVRGFGPGPIANDNPSAPDWRCFPPDARAILEPMPAARRGPGAPGWRLRFAPRWRPGADPLTGWTGDGDPLATIQLRFPDRASAETYCRRQGLGVTAHSQDGVRRPIHARLPRERPPVLCCSPAGPHAMCCGRYPIVNALPDGRHERELAG